LSQKSWKRRGVTATLAGGAAVSIYSENKYQSKDLDFVTSAHVENLKVALAKIGFQHTGKPRLSVFEHDHTDWYLEFPPGPLAFGNYYMDTAECELIETGFGKLRVISPTHSVMDRLTAAVAWDDKPSLEQAVLVAESVPRRIDWEQLATWVEAEKIGRDAPVLEFYKRVQPK